MIISKKFTRLSKSTLLLPLSFKQLVTESIVKNHFFPFIFILNFPFFLITSCSPENSASSEKISESKKQVWVYKHQNREGLGYTLFSIKKPINKGILPDDFLAIRDKKKEHWNCLLKWEGETLWFYTPSSRSFASHNSESGKTKWTIIEEDDFNHFFYNEKDAGYIRFSSHCGQPDVFCLDAEEIVIAN